MIPKVKEAPWSLKIPRKGIPHGPLTRYVKLQVAHAPGMPGKFFPAAVFKGNRSRHASRHVRDARAVMHVGIAYLRWRVKRSRYSPLMRTCNIAYLARGPWIRMSLLKHANVSSAPVLSTANSQWNWSNSSVIKRMRFELYSGDLKGPAWSIWTRTRTSCSRL